MIDKSIYSDDKKPLGYSIVKAEDMDSDGAMNLLYAIFDKAKTDYIKAEQKEYKTKKKIPKQNVSDAGLTMVTHCSVHGFRCEIQRRSLSTGIRKQNIIDGEKETRVLDVNLRNMINVRIAAAMVLIAVITQKNGLVNAAIIY